MTAELNSHLFITLCVGATTTTDIIEIIGHSLYYTLSSTAQMNTVDYNIEKNAMLKGG